MPIKNMTKFPALIGPLFAIKTVLAVFDEKF